MICASARVSPTDVPKNTSFVPFPIHHDIRTYLDYLFTGTDRLHGHKTIEKSMEFLERMLFLIRVNGPKIRESSNE